MVSHRKMESTCNRKVFVLYDRAIYSTHVLIHGLKSKGDAGYSYEVIIKFSSLEKFLIPVPNIRMHSILPEKIR